MNRTLDDNEIETAIVAEDVLDEDVEEEFNFHAMRQDDITVSPITEVTEPISEYQSESITPTEMMDTGEPGDSYPENSPTPPPIDQQQKNMPCESTILFEQAENQIRNEVEKEEIDEFEAAEKQILEEQMEVDEEPPPPPKGAYDIDYSKFDDPNFNPFETKTKLVETFDEPGDETPPAPKGAYNMDFDKFEDPNFNPFETKTKVQNNFDTDKTPVVSEPVIEEKSLREPPVEDESAKELTQLVTQEPAIETNADSTRNPSLDDAPKEEQSEINEPTPPKGAYDIDYSKFDDPNFNPFETKTKVVETFEEPTTEEAPLPPKGAYNMEFDKFDDPNFNPFETKTKVVDNFDTETKKPEPAVDKSPLPAKEPGDDLDQLNTNFEAPKRKPPTLGKNRKPIKKKAPPKAKPKPVSASLPIETEEEVPAPKGAYDIDYSKFDDPNFNPFETKTKVVETFDKDEGKSRYT